MSGHDYPPASVSVPMNLYPPQAAREIEDLEELIDDLRRDVEHYRREAERVDRNGHGPWQSAVYDGSHAAMCGRCRQIEMLASKTIRPRTGAALPPSNGE